jgi:hypothetical protein
VCVFFFGEGGPLREFCPGPSQTCQRPWVEECEVEERVTGGGGGGVGEGELEERVSWAGWRTVLGEVEEGFR